MNETPHDMDLCACEQCGWRSLYLGSQESLRDLSGRIRDQAARLDTLRDGMSALVRRWWPRQADRLEHRDRRRLSAMTDRELVSLIERLIADERRGFLGALRDELVALGVEIPEDALDPAQWREPLRRFLAGSAGGDGAGGGEVSAWEDPWGSLRAGDTTPGPGTSPAREVPSEGPGAVADPDGGRPGPVGDTGPAGGVPGGGTPGSGGPAPGAARPGVGSGGLLDLFDTPAAPEGDRSPAGPPPGPGTGGHGGGAGGLLDLFTTGSPGAGHGDRPQDPGGDPGGRAAPPDPGSAGGGPEPASGRSVPTGGGSGPQAGDGPADGDTHRGGDASDGAPGGADSGDSAGAGADPGGEDEPARRPGESGGRDGHTTGGSGADRDLSRILPGGRLRPDTPTGSRARRSGGRPRRGPVERAVPPAAVGDAAERILRAVEVPRPVFTSDLPEAAGVSADDVTRWEEAMRAMRLAAPVRFIQPRARHKTTGALILPHQWASGDPPRVFRESLWARLLETMRGTSLYETAWLVRRLGDRIMWWAVHPGLVELRVGGDSRGAVGLLVVDSAPDSAGLGDRVADAAVALGSGPFAVIAVLTTARDLVDPWHRFLQERFTDQDLSVPVVAGTTWDWAAGAVLRTVHGLIPPDGR